VKIVKWFLSGLVCLFLSPALRGDAAGDLFVTGSNALNNGDYTAATQSFDQIITNYPTFSNIDEVRSKDGIAYLHMGNFPKAIEILSKEASPAGRPEYRTAALFYTGMAKLFQAGKLPDPNARKQMFLQAAASLTDMVNYVHTAPTTDNEAYMEEALYNRALANFYAESLPAAEKDLLTLQQPPFSTSLQEPDYLLLLGNLYAREASTALNNKQPDAAIQGFATQALDTFGRVSRDTDALVQANDANLAIAEVLYLIASLDSSSSDGYQKALEAFRNVRRKEDMVALQQQNLDALKARSQRQLQASGGTASDATSRLIDRETQRLSDLKNGPDPVIQALIRIAECYNAMKQGDEARTVLHRLAHATFTPDQQQEVDFALVYSYVLSGQTDKGDKALTDYLAKHPGDPQAQGLSVQMANTLLKNKDNNGALAQAIRSLKDFPNGAYVGEAIALKVRALTALGRNEEAKRASDDFAQQNPNSTVTFSLALSAAQRESSQGDFNAALADYAKVKDDPRAGDLRASGDAGYIQMLQSLGRYDDVVKESQDFAAKYPTSPALPSVLVMGGIAMDLKHDPGAVAALQDVARKYPADDDNSPGAFALYYVVNIYQRAGKVPEMIQAAHDLVQAFPKQYALLLQAADAVSAAEVKQKKFDAAVAEYQPLISATDPAVAAEAQDKIGSIWLAAAKAMGAYQSMQQLAQRTEAEKRLGTAEQSFVNVLKTYPTQLAAVDDAFKGLDDALVQRRSWGLLKEPDFENYFTKVTADLTDPDMQVRVELAKAALVFLAREPAAQYPAALTRFRAAVTAHPDLRLTRVEATRYGDLLLAAKDYTTAQQVYTTLLQNADPKDQLSQADGDYGLGATYLAQGDVTQAQTYFTKMKALNNGAAWHPHILDADYGLALAQEKSGDLASAKATYAMLMQAPGASTDLQAKATLGYGRILEAQGYTTKPATAGTIEYAVYYYQQVDNIYGPAVPDLSAEGLFDAGQLYGKAGDKVNARKQYEAIKTNYKASEWAPKAQAAEDQLGP
jgi:TolA-binding protein